MLLRLKILLYEWVEVEKNKLVATDKAGDKIKTHEFDLQSLCTVFNIREQTLSKSLWIIHKLYGFKIPFAFLFLLLCLCLFRLETPGVLSKIVHMNVSFQKKKKNSVPFLLLR